MRARDWARQSGCFRRVSVELALLPLRASPSNPDLCAAGKRSCRSLWNTSCGVRSDRYKGSCMRAFFCLRAKRHVVLPRVHCMWLQPWRGRLDTGALSRVQAVFAVGAVRAHRRGLVTPMAQKNFSRAAMIV